MRGMRVPWWRFLIDVILFWENSKSPSWLLVALRENREGNKEEWWKEGRGGENNKAEWRNDGCRGGEKMEEGWRGESCGLVCGWAENGRERGKFVEDERESVGEQPNFKLFKILNYEREFYKIHIIREERELFNAWRGMSLQKVLLF